MNQTFPWQSLVSQSLGYSDWLTKDQQSINHFADVTEDHQFIHVDPDAAAKTSIGNTMAHGFLSFSLVTTLMYELIAPYRGNSTIVNYGSNKLRFITPVKSGSRVRLHMVVTKITEKIQPIHYSPSIPPWRLRVKTRPLLSLKT
ncbi:MAG: acyl dehydratase [Paraglaciecola sp.]|jgi:acyl dehydratase